MTSLLASPLPLCAFTTCVALSVALAQPTPQVGSGAGASLGSVSLLPAGPLPEGKFVECTRLLRTFTGVSAGDQFGWVSAPLDDLDRDGVSEVVITAASAGQAFEGWIYVVSPRTGREFFRARGGGGGRRLGYSARAAGDVNGDGFGDVIAGAPFGTRGRARIYSGNPADEGLLLFQSLRGSSTTTYGTAVIGLGDLDGDGFGDFAVGDSGADGNGANAGRVWVLSGGDNGATVLFTVDGESPGANLGSALGRLKDVTGDGRDELIVGAQNAGPGARGRAYVYDVVQQLELHAFTADPTGSSFGQFFVSGVGDVNANGFDDVYVGDFADSENGPGAGKAYVFDGDTGSAIHVLPGQAGDGFGIGRGMGDVDGDGHADLLLCGYTHSSGANQAGQAFVLSGRDASVLQVVTSRTASDQLGFDAHGIGDVDGDGELDLFLTAAANPAKGAQTGRCYVVAGGSPIATLPAGSNGTGGMRPRLAASACPVLGSDLEVELLDGLGGASAVFVLGATQVAVPIAGAQLVASPDALFPLVLDGARGSAGVGTARLPITVPPVLNTLGQPILVQAVVFDPAGPGGLAFSDGLRLERTQP